MGLVDRLVPAESVLESAADLASSIAANAPWPCGRSSGR